MQLPTDRDFLNEEEMARYLMISRPSLLKLRQIGMSPPYMVVGKRIRYPINALQYIEQVQKKGIILNNYEKEKKNDKNDLQD